MAKRSPIPDNGPPTSAQLAREFNLEDKGRENGRNGEPGLAQTGLDEVEIKVDGHCAKVLDTLRREYGKNVRIQEEKMYDWCLDGSDVVVSGKGIAIRDTDTKACLELKELVQEETPALQRLQREAQEAIGDMDTFKKNNGLERAADIPDRRIVSWCILILAFMIEVFVNGFFFATRVAGGFLEGFGQALLISFFNVGIVGLLAAIVIRYSRHYRDLPRMAGYIGILVVTVLVVVGNLFAAHYRDALPYDYPPEPSEMATAADLEGTVASCWRGDTADVANAEALCLLTTRWFSLEGFMSYMLMVFGIGFCAVGAWKWGSMDDPYPGYGKRERKRRKTEQELIQYRKQLLKVLTDRWTKLDDKQRVVFDEPLEQRKHTDTAIKERGRLHADFVGDFESLRASCQGAIEIYRTANRQARQDNQPVPSHWTETWRGPDWPHPGELTSLSICSEEKAVKRAQLERAALDKRLKNLSKCYERCKDDVDAMTRLRNA